MTLGSMDADRFVRALAEENAQLRALLQTNGNRSLPPSPPLSAADSSKPVTPLGPLSDPLIKAKLPALPSAKGDDDDDTSPLRTIIELLRVQIASQASAQDQLLDQLGQLRTSHANLQAATSDVTDELVVLRERSARLAAEVEAERLQRKAIEDEKTAEAEKVATLRSKVEESRRAIMRLQDEAATRRASDSRRGSAVLLSTPLTDRRGSTSDSRRPSVIAPPLPLPARRASVAVCDSTKLEAVGLGLDLAGTPAAASPAITTASPVIVPRNSQGHHRRALSIASVGTFKADAPVDERLTALRSSQRSASAIPLDLNTRRRSSLAPLEEGHDGQVVPHSIVRRPGSLSLASRPGPLARGSIGGAGVSDRRRSFNGVALRPSNLATPVTGDSEAEALRIQLEALQRRLAEVESAPSVAGQHARTLQDYVLASSPAPDGAVTPAFATAPNSRRPSVAPPAFGSFSFQSRGRNPALLDTPPSPSGGSFSPGGSRRCTADDAGPFARRNDEDEAVKGGPTSLESLMARCESAEKAVVSDTSGESEVECE